MTTRSSAPDQVSEAMRSLRERMDVTVFIGTFITGVILYVLFHSILNLPQWMVTSTIVLILLLYGVVSWVVPRLRLRLDQAGDNAYYLGLLFTLTSMAFALSEFGAAAEADKSGTEQIVANFGIALASTITGIFLRVFLHQMRVDPAEIEQATRIELAEAAKTVQSSIQVLSMDLGRFHEEVRQRSSDVIRSLLDDSIAVARSLREAVEKATNEMLNSVGNAHTMVLRQTEFLTRQVGEVAVAATEAIGKLKEVAPPPLTLSRRLDQLTKTLENTGNQIERVPAQLQGSVDSTSRAITEVTKLVVGLAESLQNIHSETVRQVGESSKKVDSALEAIAQRLGQEGDLLARLAEQSRRSVDESARAQSAAVEVLTRLAEVARTLETTLRETKVEAGVGAG